MGFPCEESTREAPFLVSRLSMALSKPGGDKVKDNVQ